MILNRSNYMWLVSITSFVTVGVEGRNCVFKYKPDLVFKCCGYCGVCKITDDKSKYGTCDEQYLIRSGLFTRSSNDKCELKDHCREGKGAECKDFKSSTGLCNPLYGTYKCQCKEGFVGKNCEHEIDSKLKPEKKARLFADVLNVVFTPIFYSIKYALVYISFIRKGFQLKIYIDNGRERLVFNEQKCDKNLETLHQVCLGLFNDTNNVRICSGISQHKEREFKTKGCMISLKTFYTPNFDKNSVIYKYNKKINDNNIIANVETTSVVVYNLFGNFVNIPVFNYTFDMINMHTTSGFRSKCSFRIRLINCGKNMQSMPKVSAYSDMAILWSLKIVAFDVACLNYGQVRTSWKVWRLQENHDELTDKPLLEMYQRQFYNLKEAPLIHGTYKVKLTLSAGLSEYVLREKAYCYFEVVRFPLQATLVGGSLRKVYYKKPVAFNILLSFIPDRFEPDNHTKIFFNWQCDQPLDKICKPFKTVETLRRIKGPFPESTSYKFTLSAKTVDQLGFKMEQNQETQVINFSPDPVVPLMINCLKNCGGNTFKANPQEIIHLKVSLEEPNPRSDDFRYQWRYKCLENAQDMLKEVDEIRMEDNLHSDSVLVVGYNKLNTSSKYLFVVTVENLNSHAEIVVETDEPPPAITCQVNPTSGFRGTTFFSISCKGQNKSNNFPSLTYEFYNRHEDEDVGRMLGYSMTGEINRIILTRDKLCVCVTNFFGSSSEYEVSVELSPSPKNSSSKTNSTRSSVFIGNYIDKMGVLSSRSDSEASHLFWVDSTAGYLKSLTKEPVHELMGAILLQNTLHQVACEKLVHSVKEKKFKCKTILNLASLMYHSTRTITDSLLSSNMNPRLMNTRRTKNFVTSVLRCSSVVLELSSLHQHKSNDINVHDCLKASTYYTIDTLNSLAQIIALQIFPSIKQWYESKSVHMFVTEVTPGYFENLEGKQHFTQIIIFEINPFWWGTGNKINTNVFSVRLYKDNKPVANPETEEKVEYILSFNDFQPALVSGSVTQLDPAKGPKVTDFEIPIYRIIPEVHSKTFVKFTDLESNKTLKVLILKNLRPDFDLMNTKAINITGNSNELSFDTDGVEDDLFYYMGILPGPEVEVNGTVNYTFVLFSARCVVRKQKAWMSGSKCIVKQDFDVYSQILTCSCNLLSLVIGGYVYVPTNCVNPFSNLNLFLDTPDNPFIILLLVLVFTVYSFLLIWSNFKDREDAKKLLALPLEDNCFDDSHVYLVGVFTGSRIGAGTTSNVGIKLIGEECTSRAHVFSSTNCPILQIGSDDWFLLFTPQKLGALLQVRLWIDYSGSRPNWYCKMVFVCDVSNYETSFFNVEKWFGVNINETCLEKLIKASSAEEINSFGAMFCDNLVYGFRDLHFFVSLFHKHPRSVVSRTQRLSVALSSVLLSICVSILIYSISSPVFEDVPAYYVSSEVFLYSFICSTIATTYGLVNMSYFRKCYSIKENTNHSHSHSVQEKQCARTANPQIYSKHMFRHSKSKKTRFFEKYCACFEKYIKACYLIPVHNSESFKVVKIDTGERNLAWMITIIVTVVSSYIIIVSSLTFGEVKTSIWITCLLNSLVLSIVVILSINVILISFIASLRKVRIFDLLSHRIETKNLSFSLEEEKFGKLYRKSYKRIFFDTYIPKKEERNRRVVQKHYRTIRIWVASFIIESIVLLVLVYLIMGEFETLKYFQSSSTVCYEILYKHICDDIYYADTSFYDLKTNVLKSTLPKLFKTKWYNGEELSSKELSYQKTGWLGDITSRLVGDPQLLQVRVQKNLCKIPSIMSFYTKVCFPVLSPSTVDRKNYCLGWTDDNDWTAILFQESPWSFTKGVGVGVTTSSGYYIKEGSYVTSLLNTLELAKHVTKNLIDTNWMDRQTRVIVLQFLTYNPNNNIFTSSYFVTEMFPTQFIKTTHEVKSIGFYYHKLSLQGIIFILFSVFFFIRMGVTINIMGVDTFFKDLWNCYDVFIFVVYFSTVVDYVQLLYFLGRQQEVVEASVTDKNVHLESVFQSVDETSWALCYTFISVAVRFVRITRINERCRQYLNDIVNTKTELFWTLLISFVGLYRQFRLIMYFIEPPSVYDVIDILGYTSKYHPLEKDYHSTGGKVVALLLFQFSEASLFSFTISLIHHHRQVKLRRVSLL